MSNNPIDELRGMQVPVSEQEWEAIVHDKRYLKKFGKKARLSPKGRAALIAGAVAVLITVPILISTLSHKTADTVQDSRPVAQTVVPQQEAANETTPTVSPVTTNPVTAPKSEEARQALPSTSGATVQAATHEQSTLTAVTEARVPSSNPSAVTSSPTSTSTPTPTKTIILANNTPTETSTTTKHEPLTSRSDNHPQPANTNLEENQPVVEKSQDNSESESEALNEFFIPSAFSPNGDGVNDLFFVKANFVPKNFEMNILNRNGELVFRTREIDSQWDGKIRNQSLPEGVYVCIIKYTDQNGDIKTKKGQVLLLP